MVFVIFVDVDLRKRTLKALAQVRSWHCRGAVNLMFSGFAELIAYRQFMSFLDVFDAVSLGCRSLGSIDSAPACNV
jgi:hypothetical protein